MLNKRNIYIIYTAISFQLDLFISFFFLPKVHVLVHLRYQRINNKTPNIKPSITSHNQCNKKLAHFMQWPLTFSISPKPHINKPIVNWTSEGIAQGPQNCHVWNGNILLELWK